MADIFNTASASSVAQDGEKKCGHCGKTRSQLTNPLKCCAKCHEGSYWSRDCQKADWKNHKKVCGKQTQSTQKSNSDLVAAFNALPRKELAPSGTVRNHWHFSIRHFPIPPAGDLLFFINPEARYVHTEGPAQTLPLSTAAERADVVVPFLLKAFATATQARLKELGVREDLHLVQVGNTEDDHISDEEWPDLLSQLQGVFETASTGGRSSNAGHTATAAPAPTSTPSSANPFQALSDGQYLHNMSEPDAYCAIVDSYRLRVDDEYTFGSGGNEPSLYSENPRPVRGFQQYIDRIEAKGYLLPPWWSVEKRRACERHAQDRNQRSCIFSAVEKSDISEQYKNTLKPMELRMCAEEVKGWNVCGQGPGSGAS